MEYQLITAALAKSPEVTASQLLAGVCTAVVAMYPDGQPELPWAGYLVKEDGQYVGTCAFKSQPVDGAVEIAYFTFPEHEGRGVATQMARRLIELAAAHGITRIRAQTLPVTSASTHILQKLGFAKVGTIIHPEDGPVWEWQR